MSHNNRNRRNRQEKKKSKIFRCKTHSRPVFGHEICNLFSSKNNSIKEKNCENCKNSF